MKERSDRTRQGCILVLMAGALVGTFFLAVVNWTIAPMNASWLLMAAKECAHSVWLPLVGGLQEFCGQRRMSLALSGNDGKGP